jgi:hypothetical protein
MQHVQSTSAASKKFAVKICSLASVALLVCIAGCGSNGTSATATATPGPQSYFAPYVAGTTSQGVEALTGPEIYTIDLNAEPTPTFSQSTFQLQAPQQQGAQVLNTGDFTTSPRNLLSLEITTSYSVDTTTNAYVPTAHNPPISGSFAVQLAAQAGGFLQMVGQPVAPLAPATECPNLGTAQTYQFLTIPGGLINAAASGQQASAWNPTTDTAYGTVDISTNGSTVTFNNIQQRTLPSVGGTGVPTQQPSSPVTGTCAPTGFGNTISVGQLSVSDPTQGNSFTAPPQAKLAIGPTGMLVEHNGAADSPLGTFPGTSPALKYDNTLGAGTGAVGLPKPSSALDTGALVGAQYLGFVYGSGIYSGSSSSPTPPAGWSSHLASFGFSSTPSSCASVAPSTATMIYGGDFPQANGQDNPSASPNGFGNCDLAIDLGTQDPSNNGSYPQATVWMGASYAANTTGKTYSFPAVAIAGQLNGKNAIFVLGVDSTQPWAIYLLQSN